MPIFKHVFALNERFTVRSAPKNGPRRQSSTRKISLTNRDVCEKHSYFSVELADLSHTGAHCHRHAAGVLRHNVKHL